MNMSRVKVQQDIFKICKKQQVYRYLRGSWKNGDFHWNIDKGITYSDIDILIEGISIELRQKMAKAITDETANFSNAPIHTSIHPQNALDLMDLKDSRVLNICEYISKFISFSSYEQRGLEYLRAKILLLLLRNHTSERYIDVRNRIQTPEVQRAYGVKLGLYPIFSIEDARTLIYKFGDQMSKIFYDHCLRSIPSSSYINSIVSTLQNCNTIDRWLKDYMIDKLYNSNSI